MLFSPAISEAEIRAVQDGVANDTRGDGRTLTQRRPFTVAPNYNAGAASADADYDGSCVEVQCGGTTVVAAATPSVVQVHDGDSGTAGAARGQLYISIDATPAVVDYYAQALRNRSGRYRHAFLSFAATAIRQTFGAESVTVQAQLGVAEAELVADDGIATADGAAAEEGDAGGEGVEDKRHVNDGDNNAGGCGNGFPGEQLYIGSGYAFRIDMDVHVLQANGGNLPSIISLAVHAALKKIKLPCVTLYETSGGVSLEVDPRKAFGKPVDWSRLPVLAVMLVSPTRHYVVDPTLPEELALPQQLHVAVNAAGQVCHTRFQQLPSRRGNVWRLGGQQQQPPSGMNMPDFAAMLHDAPYICQAMISECDEALQKGE